MASDEQQSKVALRGWLKAQVAGRTILFVGLDCIDHATALAGAGNLVVGIDADAARVTSAEDRLGDEPEETRARLQFRTGAFDTQVGVLPNAPERRFDTVILGPRGIGEQDVADVLDVAFERLNPGGRVLMTLPFAGAAEQAGISWRVQPSLLTRWVAKEGVLQSLQCEGEWLCLAANKLTPDNAAHQETGPDAASLLEVAETIWAADRQAAARQSKVQSELLHTAEALGRKRADEAAAAKVALRRLALAPDEPADSDTGESRDEATLAARKCDWLAHALLREQSPDAESSEECLALVRLAFELDPTPPRQARLGRLLLDSGAHDEALTLLSAPEIATALSSGLLRRCGQTVADIIPPALPDLRLAARGRAHSAMIWRWIVTFLRCLMRGGPRRLFASIPISFWSQATTPNALSLAWPNIVSA
ncbi:class I SAM-dependent methyltransferase [Rhodobacteraceae bacterium D3-12]|nr:class I SAM-dependent methyltransferase [Rhodobacteraceae bacterium D3-12]